MASDLAGGYTRSIRDSATDTVPSHSGHARHPCGAGDGRRAHEGVSRGPSGARGSFG